MSYNSPPNRGSWSRPAYSSGARVGVDFGLRQYMLRVYNFITAATFVAMSLYGYTTRRDLSQFGSFLFMGLIGIVLASLVNIFIASSALQFAISVIGVVVFTGLTAWDTQRIKEIYLASDPG